MEKTMASLQAFLSFLPRAPHALSRAQISPSLLTPATQATINISIKALTMVISKISEDRAVQRYLI